MNDLQREIARLESWASGHPGCRIQLGQPLTDADIDEAFTQIQPHYGEFAYAPSGDYRAFLRHHNGLRVQLLVDGEHQDIDEWGFRVFSTDLVARAQREYIFFRSPEFESGVGKKRTKHWLSRNHLVAFAGGPHAPSALWVLDADAQDDAIFVLDEDAAFNDHPLHKDRDGNWCGPTPTPHFTGFHAWLAHFVSSLEAIDPTEYV